jgi:metallo-beta-lactamase class B
MSGATTMRVLVAAALAAGLASVGTSFAQQAGPDTLEAHIRAATVAAGLDLGGILTVCLPRNGPDPRPANDVAEPTKVFDNLYYVGLQSVSAWAVTTSQGIIVIDTLNNAQEAQNSIEGGLRRLRLNPADIKYIIITHAHADHYGGATYLADKFHAQLVMSDLDWSYLEGPQRPEAPNRGPIPKRGLSVKDGDKLTLGDTTIELYLTPPHTPGTLSLIIPLKDGSMQHFAGEWGGTAFNFAPTLENFKTYAASAERFAKIAADKKVDVPLSNHPIFDDALLKMQALKTRRSGQPHPFVTGAASEARYLTVAAECAKARAAALTEKN